METDMTSDNPYRLLLRFSLPLVFFPCLHVLYILRSSTQGLGNSAWPMLSSLIQVIIRILCAHILTAGTGYTGIFYEEISAWIGADLFLTFILLWQYRLTVRTKYGTIGSGQTV